MVAVVEGGSIDEVAEVRSVAVCSDVEGDCQFSCSEVDVVVAEV